MGNQVYEHLPTATKVKQKQNSQSTRRIATAIVAAIGIVGFLHISPVQIGSGACPFGKSHLGGGKLCPQADELKPSTHNELWNTLLNDYYNTPEFKATAAERLGGAVRVRTESFDRMEPVGVDPRWEVFGDFHNYLLVNFPLVHSTLKLTKVNTYGLLYHWEGSDTTLKPLLLAAHQDVVPVDAKTEAEWTYPPFSGYFDGERIWGRGSADDKSGLIGIMSAIETLLKQGTFQPTRSIVVAFGFDEETSGVYGAQALSQEIIRQFGETSMAMILDEGAGFRTQYDAVIAVPGVAEKGYLDVRVEVSSPGGHSSVPPAHTSIGMLASLLVHFENNPFKVHLERGTPMYNTMLCIAEHAPGTPKALRKALRASVHSDKALRHAEEILFKDAAIRSFVGTTQAIDLVSGGVKSNALPEQAYAVVNHRVATQSNLDFVKSRDTALLEHYAKKYDLSFDAFGKTIHPHANTSYGSLKISDAWGTGLEPAPITPTTNAAPYDLLSGSIKSTYNAHRSYKNKQDIKVAPGIMSGNTDTRYYWKLTRHIFRYNHHNAGNATTLPPGVHTVNEFQLLDGQLEMIKFFTTLILNADESRNI